MKAGLTKLLNNIKKNTVDKISEQVKVHAPKARLRLSRRMNQFTRNVRENFSLSNTSKTYGPLTRADQIIFSMHERTYDTSLSGDVMLNRIIDIIDNYKQGDQPFVLRVDQQMMVSHILCAFLPFLYKQNIESNKARLLKMLKVPAIKELLVIIASRRVGKTTCIAAVVAAVMIAVPNSTGVIFSLAQRAAKRVMEMVITFLNMHPDGRALLSKKGETVKNFEELKLIGDTVSAIKLLFAFPDSGDVCFYFYFYFILKF